MKGGRSHHRMQSSDPPPPDEWVDGSWTVDCICGVTFDDGEEMVKCDECGVWVHTRCSRYVKGDETFSCDKCKSKMINATMGNPKATPQNNHNNTNDNAVNGTEETEVAQFLIELPTKTIPMENNNNNSNSHSGIASHRPFKLWTEISMEERVHVQGIPGGDPSLFSGGGLSSIFGPQLWKCTGYVPKKFNFRYREFPSWNDEDDDGGDGAGVLLSISKGTAANATAAVMAATASPVAAALVDLGGGSGGGERKGDLKEGERVQNNGVKKERSLLRPFVVHSSKRNKEEFGGSSSKDQSSGKKRIRTNFEKEVDPKKRSTSNSSKTDRGPKISKDNTRDTKNKNLKDEAVQEHISKGCFAVDTIMEEPNNNLTTTEDSSDPFADTARHKLSVRDVLPEKTGHTAPSMVEIPLKTDEAVTSVLKNNEVGRVSSKDKDGDCLAVDNADGGLVIRSSITPHDEGVCGSVPENIDNQVSQDSDCNLPLSSAKCNVKMNREDGDDNFRKLSNFHSSPIKDLKNIEKPSDHVSDSVNVNHAVVTSLPFCENKLGLEGVDRLSVIVTDDHTNKPDVLCGNPFHAKQEPEVSEGSMETQKGFSETKDASGSVKDPHKKLASLGKSSPTSSTMNSKSLPHDLKSEDSEIPNSSAKHGVMADNNTCTKNESCPNDSMRDEISRKSVRDRPKSSLNAISKGLHSSRSTQSSVSKQGSSDARDFVRCSSSKASLGHQTGSILGSSETSVSLHHQKALQGQHKGSSSVPPKAEKFNQTSINPSILSDEELALLLHQELNSSPRVPRVPRARHGGSLPQLTSASSTSMLVKRTTSVGGKEHYLAPRRKYKDASREGLCSSREHEDETKRIEKEKGPPSSDMTCAEDASVKEDGRGSMTAANSSTNNVVSATSAYATNSPNSPYEDQNLASVRNSPRSIFDDDTASAGRPVHRTLPELINDIMSKGKRMTYEELCNAVLPHWHNLRKHNGERYAYSSHSQAVLDCLRNRHEWARLVDRGPKTNSNRKRRSKLDAEDSDDSGYGKGKASKGVEGKNFELRKEDYPKGKRKARKRRRLALQGRAVNDVRRRQKTVSQTDEDGGPFSNSSEVGMFSEDDEIQVGGRIGQAGSTSDEAGSA